MADAKKIILLEDDRSSAKLVSTFLEKRGYQVLESHSARFAIELALKERPDLLIADILLPDMKGSDAVKELRASSVGKDLKVLFITSLLNKGDQPMKEIKLTVDGIDYPALGKPFKPDQLVEIVQRLLGDDRN